MQLRTVKFAVKLKTKQKINFGLRKGRIGILYRICTCKAFARPSIQNQKPSADRRLNAAALPSQVRRTRVGFY